MLANRLGELLGINHPFVRSSMAYSTACFVHLLGRRRAIETVANRLPIVFVLQHNKPKPKREETSIRKVMFLDFLRLDCYILPVNWNIAIYVAIK
jgi:hypothetical protein